METKTYGERGSIGGKEGAKTGRKSRFAAPREQTRSDRDVKGRRGGSEARRQPPAHSDGLELEQRKPAATLLARQRCQGRRLGLAMQFISVDVHATFLARQYCQGRRLDLALQFISVAKCSLEVPPAVVCRQCCQWELQLLSLFVSVAKGNFRIAASTWLACHGSQETF